MSKAMTTASKEQLVELMQYLSQNISVPTIGIGGGFAPIGTIISYMGTTAPQDYLICDGTTYNIADYKQLSDFFAAQFGSANFFGGDGVTTFKVPDLRGEFLRGTGTNSHTDQGSGSNVGVHQDATEIPIINEWNTSNTKGLIGVELKHDTASSNGAVADKRDGFIKTSLTNRLLISTPEYTIDKNTSTPSGSAYAYTSRPTNTSVLYCIKAVAAGDVYSTTERVVGTWIDGKPIYQVTVNTTAPVVATDGNTEIKYVDISQAAPNMGFVIDLKYTLKLVANTACLVGSPFFATNGGNQMKATINTLGELTLVSQSTYYNNANMYVTIRYTKTTD